MSLSLTNNKVIAMEFSDDKVQLLKNTVCKNSTDDELQLFLHVCNRTGLDPFRNQIYAIKRANKMTIQTGIDGFRLIAERTGKYSPGKEPSFIYDVQGKLKSATSYIKKQTNDGSWHEISATAFYSEYVQEYNGKPSQFWAKMPHTMLSKVAEALALRKAFPADFSGLYTTEEMAQASNGSEIEISESESKMADPLPIMEEKKEEPDLTEEEINQYLTENWPGDEEKFKEYMKDISNTAKWSMRKCRDTFNRNPTKTKESYMGWCMRKVGL